MGSIVDGVSTIRQRADDAERLRLLASRAADRRLSACVRYAATAEAERLRRASAVRRRALRSRRTDERILGHAGAE